MNVGIIQTHIVVGDFMGNMHRVADAYDRAVKLGADIVVGPEDAITGYCIGDMRFYASFMERHDAALAMLLVRIGEVGLVIGITELNNDKIGGKQFFNSGVLIVDGAIRERQYKTNLATDSVFDDYRYFEPNPGAVRTFKYRDVKCAILICQDIWEEYDKAHHAHHFRRNPVSELVGKDVQLLLVPNASPYYLGKADARLEMVRSAGKTTGSAVAYANFWGGQDELVFDGRGIIINKDGVVVGAACAFADDVVVADLSGPEVDYEGDGGEQSLQNLDAMLTLSLRDYVEKNSMKGVVLGLSGGIDSALCAAIAVRALGAPRVIGLRMPSQYSSEHSLGDAETLGKTLGIRVDTIPIKEEFDLVRHALETSSGVTNVVAAENLQARIRGQMVMYYANSLGLIGIATGNKSEMAVGYATLYGDMCGGFALIKDVYKMQVFALARWYNKDAEVIPWNTINKPPSAELHPGQKDTDSLPDYPVLDAILEGYIEEVKGLSELVSDGFTEAIARDVIRKTNLAEHKRRQAPFGPIVTTEGLTNLNRRVPVSFVYQMP